jgi:hypothetical protein
MVVCPLVDILIEWLSNSIHSPLMEQSLEVSFLDSEMLTNASSHTLRTFPLLATVYVNG